MELHNTACGAHLDKEVLRLTKGNGQAAQNDLGDAQQIIKEVAGELLQLCNDLLGFSSNSFA